MQYARILIVEDDPIASEILAAWGRQFGSMVTVVTSTIDADAALAEGTYDLILSDVHLPGNHQLEWAERVLSGEFPPSLVLVTGNPELTTTMRAANLPVAGYLVKPPDLAALTTLAQRLISSHRHRRELRELSRDAAVLLTQLGTESGPIREKLLQLSRSLSVEAGRSPRLAAPIGDEIVWRDLICDTIATLEKTKHNFRSKELGRLRSRLEQVLGTQAVA